MELPLSIECKEEIDLIPILLKMYNDNEGTEIAPSSFMAEMKLSTEERIEKLRKTQPKLNTQPILKINTFSVTPDIVIFQNFKPGTVYTAPVTLRNVQNVSKPLKGNYKPSPYFSVSCTSEIVPTHIAPGISIVFQVQFTPDEIKDYKYKIIFLTTDEKFLVPVIAIGYRPLLDFPDLIDLPDAPIKMQSQKTILVRNLGKVSAVFTVETREPFSVDPNKAVLLPEKDMQLTVFFKPTKLGKSSGYLIVTYESGERLSIKTNGCGKNLNIRLEKGSLRFRRTFMNLSRQKTITLFNNSKHTIKFQWKKFGSLEMEEEELKKVKKSLHFMKEHEKIRDNKLETYKIIDGSGHSKICDRIYEDELEEFVSQDKFLYQYKNFQIIPMTGEVWPKQTLEFLIIFTPTEVNAYSSTAYLEVTGHKQRLKLILNGMALGPKVVLNVNFLNANKIYMCAIHQYEVAAMNTGDIPATLLYKPTTPEFGGSISVTPSLLYLDPKECGAFVLQFSSKRQGKFLEVIEYEIVESKEILRLVFKGEIVCPLLSIEVKEVDFGVVAIGYPIRRILTLINPSMVPIGYTASVLSDGEVPAIACEEYASLPVRCGPYNNAREFDFFPRTGVVSANDTLNVEITLLTNTIRQHVTALKIRMWDTDKHSISLPIKYKSQVPNIVCVPSEINIRFCFVTYPYNRTIVLYNESHIPGYFHILPQTKSKQGGITFNTSITEGFIRPMEEVEVILTITTKFLGEDEISVSMQFFGDEPTKICSITCVGQGPVVTTNPDQLDFGKVTLLETTNRELTVTNDSPITAFITTKLSPKSVFMVEPNKLELPPEDSVILNVFVYLCNSARVHDNLHILVENGSNTVCLLKAAGVGTSILCEPKIYPVLNIGTYLTHRRYYLDFKLTNKGNKIHKMHWSRNKQLRQLKENSDVIIPSFFKITPGTFDLAFDESVDAIIEGYTTMPGLVQETFYLYALTQRSKHQQIIITLEVVADFVEPMVRMSKTEMSFRQDVGPKNKMEFLVDEVTITNQTNLPIEMDIYLEYPFYLLTGSECSERENRLRAELDNGETIRLLVGFDPSTETLKCFTVRRELKIDYIRHPKVDIIHLFGEVNYPNIHIIPNFIEFPCIPQKTSTSAKFVLRNVSPLPVSYSFEWRKESIIIQDVLHVKSLVPIHSIESDVSRTSSDVELYLEGLKMRALENELKEPKTSASSVVPIKNTKSKPKPGTPKIAPSVPEKPEDVQDENRVKSTVENVYYKSLTEKNPSYYYIQIEDELKPTLRLSEVLGFPQRNLENALSVRALLYSMVSQYDEKELDIEVIKSLPRYKTTGNDMTSIIDVVPARGFLKPFECQIISTNFHPMTNISLLGQLQCHIVGGMTETLGIAAIATDISYSIDQVYVNFGRQVFCQIQEKSITLKNIGHSEFEFVASAEEFPNPVPPHFLLQAGCLTVTPKTGIIKSGKSAELKIKYFPGIAGEFEEKFMIEIGYLPPIYINVHGYGTFPQVYLYLPRPSFYILNPVLAYLAVASITPEYLYSLKAVRDIMHYDKNQIELYDEDISQAVKQKLKKEGWVIISHNDFYPSVMDIDLSIERMILYQTIYADPNILLQHTKTHKAIIVPNFKIPPYLVDFGCVILDTVVHYTVLLFNYGPNNADIKLVPSPSRKYPDPQELGLGIQFKRTVIPMGDTKELFVIFHPTIEVYSDLDHEFCFPFYLDVGHGPRIPVEIRAIVTVPTISPKTTVLDFGNVRCGDCLKMSLILHNSGQVTSEWSAAMRKYNRKSRSESLELVRNRPVFFLKNASGILDPKARCTLDVYFEPQYEGNAESNIAIAIQQNPNRVVIALKGVGLKPTLKICLDEIQFEPTLPYIKKWEEILTIENTCSFPIEFYFADYDSEIDEEERIINLLMQLYHRTDLCTPPRKAGDKLPRACLEFYHRAVENLRDKLIGMEKEKQEPGIEQPQLALNLAEEENLERRSTRRSSTMSGKKPSKQSSFAIPEFVDPLLMKTPEEIETLLKENLKDYTHQLATRHACLNESERKELLDPIAVAISEAKVPLPEKDPTEIREAVCIIFHGAPNTNALQVANKAGLEIGLPVYSLDKLFIQSLAANASLAAMKVNEIINTAFIAIASETDLRHEEDEDIYDEIHKKIDLILSGKVKKPKTSKKGSSGKSSKKGSSKGSGSSKKSSKKSAKSSSKKESSVGSKKVKVDNRPTFMGIPEDLLLETLKHRLTSFKTGVVIESLRSIFLRQPVLALTNILKAIGNIQYINCIILSYTYEEYTVHTKYLLQLEEKRAIEDKEALARRARGASIDISELSPEQYAIFKELVLKDRKQKTLAKREALKKRLLEAKLGKKAPKDIKKRQRSFEKQMKPSSKQSGKSCKGSGKVSGKSSKRSKASSKKDSKKAKVRLSPEETRIKQEFDAFEGNLHEILHLLEHWDRKASVLLKPLSVSKGGSRIKSPGKKQSSKGSNRLSSGKKLRAASKTSILRIPSAIVPITISQEMKLKQSGIPCWILANAHENKPKLAELIGQYLRHTPELKKAIETLEESLEEKLDETAELFTVIHLVNEKRTKNISKVFIFKDDEISGPLSADYSKSIREEQTPTEDSLEDKRRSRMLDSKSSLNAKMKRRKRSSTERRRSTRQSSSGSIQNSKFSSFSTDRTLDQVSSPEDGRIFTPRAVINPGEKIKYKVFFKPETCADYQHRFTFEIIGWPTQYHLVCKGKCVLPELDMSPKKVFPKVVKKRTKKNMYWNNIFVEEFNIFDFGPLLVHDKEDLKLPVQAEFSFTNPSVLPCEVNFCLYDESEIYQYDLEMLIVQPNTTETFKISAIPLMNRTMDNQLIISIKNNPKIEIITLTSEVCKLEFSITPRSICFERVLINRTETKSLYLENESHVPVNWQFKYTDKILRYFTLSEIRGCIPAKTTHEVFITYCSEVTQDVPKHILDIEVYDKEFKFKTPLYEGSVEVSAEAVDVTIECPKELRLGEVKSGFLYTYPYTMLSKGKYNVEFSFTEILEEQDTLYREHKKIRNWFKLTPIDGILQFNKPFSAKITFFANNMVDFRNVPVINCTLRDAINKSLIETFPLVVYGKTYFSSFEICPYEQVNFGYQLIGTEKVQEIILTNNGRFEFNYEITTQKILEIKEKKARDKDKKSGGKKGGTDKSKSKSSKDTKSKTQSKSSKKSSKSSKGSDKKKLKQTKLDFGVFSVISSTGIIEPSESCKIQVFSRPKQEGVFQETLLFFISECNNAGKNGYRFNVNVASCIPVINFNDYDGMFREQYVVNRIVEFECPKEKDACCVFVKEENRLHFSRVVINNKATARIRLENIGCVHAEVTTSVYSNTAEVFSVMPERISLDSHSANYITVKFIPNGLETFAGLLTVTNECPFITGTNKFQVHLSGESTVPEVTLTKPEFNSLTDRYSIDFNPTLVRTLDYRIISFENTGPVSCEIIIEVCEDSLDLFCIVPHENTIPMLKIKQKVSRQIAHLNIVKLSPGQHGIFELHFRPVAEGLFKCLVKLHIVNNPFEMYTILVTAEGFNQDITIEGLPTVAIKQNTNTSQELFFANPGYELDFGNSFINALQKKCFKITNHSPNATYKFEISNSDKLMFIPTVGHLKPLAVKEIIATFFSKEPISISKELLELSIFQIQYLNPELEPLSWDERQNLVVWEPVIIESFTKSRPSLSRVSRNSTRSPAKRGSSGTPQRQSSGMRLSSPSFNETAIKTIKTKGEPPVEMVPGTQKILPIVFSVICDYSSYQCSEHHIEMADTLAFEIETYTFNVTNASNILLELNWKLTMDESYPKRINSATCNTSTSQNSNLGFIQRESYHSYRATHSANHISASCVLGSRSLRPIHLTGSEKFFSNGLTSSLSKSSLFSSEANHTNRSNDSWIECDTLPFTITPCTTAIPPGESKTFKVTFTPRDVFMYLVHLRSEISNLHPSLKHLDITIKARSLLPLYHFDIAPSDYLTVKRKGGKFCRDLADENTRVVEFEAIGLGITNTRSFNIINPTGESFSYKWIPADINCKDISLFHCHKPEGYVEKGKMAQATFSFLPQTTGTFEAFYRFYIQKYNLSRTFLMVGVGREPNVTFSVPHVEMRPTVTGIDITEFISIRNRENFEMDFKFKKESLYSEAWIQALKVDPFKGILQPYGEQELKIIFHPVKMGEVTFNLKCMVEKMRKPLAVSVTASCFEVQAVVFYESDDGLKVTLDSQRPNVLEMKALVPQLKQTINFTISNVGVIGLNYAWKVKEDAVANKCTISLVENNGYIKSKNDAVTVLSITPLTKVVIKKLIIKLEINYGPSYTIHLTGAAGLSLFTFSIDEYDFGPCLIQKEATSYYKKMIEFINNDDVPVTLECSMPDQNCLSTNFKTKHVAPKKTEQIVFDFHPHDIKRYYTEVEFYVNSKLQLFKVHGEGVLFFIELLDPHDKFINLGCVRVGETVTKVVKFLNNSSASIEVIFDLYDRLPYFSRPKNVLKPEFEVEEATRIVSKKTKLATQREGTGKKDDKGKDKKESKEKKDGKKDSKKDSKRSSKTDTKKDTKKVSKADTEKEEKKSNKKSARDEKKSSKKDTKEQPTVQPVESPEDIERRLIRKFVTLTPKKAVRVAPQQTSQFVIKYSPTERMKTFSEKIFYQVQDNIDMLCAFKGCCAAPDFVLERDLVAFGTVIKGCFSKQKVVLHNKGDIGAPFKWIFEKPQINFMITPKEGYISAGTSVIFLVRFKPTQITCLVQAKANCVIEGFYKHLELTLSGSCFDTPPPKEVIKFACPVRETDRKLISIHNPTGLPWEITPSIKGQYFIGPEVLIVQPNSSSSCEVTYKPLTMSSAKPHEASVFFNLPEGQGLVYGLIGTAQQPLPVKTITREITSKTYHSEILTVKNWLKIAQKFCVITETAMPNVSTNKTLYKLTGNTIIDVLPQSQKDYTWTIFVLNEGPLRFKVIFKNKDTAEYAFYEINLTVTKPPILDVVNLTTCIRIPITHTLIVQNPIKAPVVFTVHSSSPELSFTSPFTVPPYSEYPLVIKYNPLLTGVTQARIDILTKELGNYPYDFVLTGHAPKPEPYIYFSGSLGQVVSQKAILFNDTPNYAEFICQMEHPDLFYLEKAVTIPAKEKGEFDIFFEPNYIGSIQSTLTLSSPVSGTYIFPLIGACNLPKPQGPYFIKPGGNTTIMFKNPFNESKTYDFAVEPAIFNLKVGSETVKARKDFKIVVNLIPLKNLQILIDQKYPITGKLVVYCNEAELSHVKWIYYLQGDLSA